MPSACLTLFNAGSAGMPHAEAAVMPAINNGKYPVNLACIEIDRIKSDLRKGQDELSTIMDNAHPDFPYSNL